jgi:hypothetical protein
VRPEQRAALLVAGQELLAAPLAASSNTLTFDVTGVPKRGYFVRLRVDGVDSLLVDNSKPVAVFDPSQKLEIR